MTKDNTKDSPCQTKIPLTLSPGESGRKDASPDEHLRFERLISDLSARFVNITPDQVDEEIELALKRVLDFFQVDRCGLVGISPARKRLHVTHAAYAEGIERVSGDIDLADLFPWTHERVVLQGRPVRIDRMDELPERAGQDRLNCTAMGIRSYLNIPLFFEGNIASLIAIQAVRSECSWPEEYVPRLRLLGEIFINALERRNADRALQESEGRLRDITFSMADWVWEVDERGVYTYSSSKGHELFGHVVGKTPFDFMPPDEAKRVAEIFSEIAANKEPIKDLENWNIRKDGERVCLLTSGVPILDKEGNLRGYRGVDKDITRHKQAESALRKSEERYRGVVETQSEMICRFLPDTTLLFVNEAYMRYYGRSKEDLIGNKFLSSVPVEQHEDIIRYFASFGPGSPILTSEREVVFPDGTRRWHEWTDQAFFNADGRVTGFQSVGRDITERKKAEESLKQSEAALMHTKKDLQRLAGRLIFAQEEELRRLSRELHDDLTQRLAVLAIEAGKLEKGLCKIPEPCREALQTISEMKNQLIKVSEDVHNISRQIHPTILDDLGLVRATESECAALMGREDIEIVFSKEDVPAAIDNNIGLCLYRVVQEGLKNVMTHSCAKSCRIFLKGADDTICLTVTDDGVGFDPVEVRNKPGLGLSSMRERVQLVQGDFSIESQTGKGTVINVRVPLAGSGA